MPGAHVNFFEAVERARQAYVSDTSTLQAELDKFKEAMHRYQRQVATLEQELEASNARVLELDRKLAKEQAEKQAVISSRKSLIKRYTMLRKSATELENFRKTLVNMVQVSPESFINATELEASFATDNFSARLAGVRNEDGFSKKDLETITEGDPGQRRSSIPRDLLEPTENSPSPNAYSFNNMTVLSNDDSSTNAATTAQQKDNSFNMLASKLATLNYNPGSGASLNDHMDVVDVVNDPGTSPRHPAHQQFDHLDRPLPRASTSGVHGGTRVSPNKQLRVPKMDEDSIGRKSHAGPTDTPRKSGAVTGGDDAPSLSSSRSGPVSRRFKATKNWNAGDEDSDMPAAPWLDEELDARLSSNHRAGTPDRDWMRDTPPSVASDKAMRQLSAFRPFLSPRTGHSSQQQQGSPGTTAPRNRSSYEAAGGAPSEHQQQNRPSAEKAQAAAGGAAAAGGIKTSNDIDAGLLYKKIKLELTAKEFNDFAKAIAAFNSSVKTAEQTIDDVERLVKNHSLFTQMKALIYKATEESKNS